MRYLLKQTLRLLTKAVLKKYHSTIIAVTGSVGKTSTKEAVYAVLKSKFSVRRSTGNLNNEFGVPLAVIGDLYKDYSNQTPLIFWFKVIFKGIKLILNDADFPKILILELGADKPGDIELLSKLTKPQVGIITEIGEIPAHVEFYSGSKHLAEEKAKLISALPASGLAILNIDDDLVLDMKSQSRAKIMTYGFSESADIRISDPELKYKDYDPKPYSAFKLSYKDGFTPIRINALGKSQAYAVGAAAAVGIHFGMNLVEIAESLKDYQSPPGRLRLLDGIKNTLILDDTYNASPASMHLALDILSELKANRKVAILGDMLELGNRTEEAHRKIGNLAPERCDLLVCVGSRASFIADSAQNQMEQNRIIKFPNSVEAAKQMEHIIHEGDLILVKGSQSMRMEKIVEEIMFDQDKKEELLVRQGKNWKRR